MSKKGVREKKRVSQIVQSYLLSIAEDPNASQSVSPKQDGPPVDRSNYESVLPKRIDKIEVEVNVEVKVLRFQAA